MLKNLKSKSASILLLVVVISSSALILFLTISFMGNQYLKQVSSLEFSNLAENSVESGIEEAIVRYFEKSEEKYQEYEDCTTGTCAEIRRKNILYGEIKDNKNLESDKIIDKKIFIKHKGIIGNAETGIGELEVNASRLVDKVQGKLFSFEKFEFRLTAEEREKYRGIGKNWHQSDIKQLKLVWNKLNGDTNDAQISILQIRWPIGQKGNIQTHKIHFNNGGVYTFGDFGGEKNPKDSKLNLPTDDEYAGNFAQADDKFKKYEYIYILESSVSPLVFEIYGLDKDGKKIKLPDRNVYFKAKAKIGGYNFNLGGENSGRSFNKTLKAKKAIYTNFDSNFDYARNFVNF